MNAKLLGAENPWGDEMIIFGTRGITTTPETGEFRCPRCGPNTAFGRKRVRRFFTLYFIPVIPLNALGEYIECQTCNNTYDVEVLDYNPEIQEQAFQSQFELAIKQVMILMALADGVVEDTEIAIMASIYQQLSGGEISEENLRHEVDLSSRDNRGVTDYLKEVGPFLNDQGKETVIKAMFLVATADGVFDESEQKLLTEAAAPLELSRAHLKGILNDMTSDG